jgi:CRISP-associated protein Cas1
MLTTIPELDLQPSINSQTSLRVSALHALAYCPRLFYLEEVEELYTQNAAVFAGRRLHLELESQTEGEWEELFLESAELGLKGKLDALRTRDGVVIPYEHKRGRSRRDENDQPQAWESDKLQILCYTYLLELTLGIPIPEGRIRYHADNVLLRVPLDDEGKAMVMAAINQARTLQRSTHRPPVTDNERLCAACSLAPVCLPEEARLAHDKSWQPIRLFPEDDTRQILHILEPGTRVGKTGEQIKITPKKDPVITVPAQQVGQLVLHSFSQISTQALHFCADKEIGVHFVSGGGRYLGSFDPRNGSIQRRIRQYQALTNPESCLALAKKLVTCRAQSQRQLLMRGKRGKSQHKEELVKAIQQIKILINQIDSVSSIESLLGFEGNIARIYFDSIPLIQLESTPVELRFNHRNRRPPKDRFNALLGFGYALLLKDVMNAILSVGLEPALGFYHQPRTQASPLALDLMEIFRVPLVDMSIVNSINRQQWDIEADFELRGVRVTQTNGKTPAINQVWLSNSGRKKFIEIYEQRKSETWKHPVIGYSLSYSRLLELEVRLLEKEWSGEAGLFGKLTLR